MRLRQLIVISAAILVASALAASAAPAQSCSKPEGKIGWTSISIVIPAEKGRAYDMVTRSFVEVGRAPTTSGPATLEWMLPGERNLAGTQRTRAIRAAIYGLTDTTTKVTLAARETTQRNGTSHDAPLSQFNGGAGFEVWCATKAIAESLAAHTGVAYTIP